MAKLKTTPNNLNVEDFLNAVEHDTRREDSFVVLQMMKDITGEAPQMWGTSIIGFGNYHYKYDSGREGDWFLTGFSPRKKSLTIYMMGSASASSREEILSRLGKHKTGRGCLYINKLTDVDLEVLAELIRAGVAALKEKYPAE